MASSLTPAIQAPNGHVSNLINPVGVGFRITITNIVCIVLFMVVVTVRLITRVFLNKSFGHDDCKPNLSAGSLEPDTDIISQHLFFSLLHHSWPSWASSNGWYH
jgi:hypothetical protein